MRNVFEPVNKLYRKWDKRIRREVWGYLSYEYTSNNARALGYSFFCIMLGWIFGPVLSSRTSGFVGLLAGYIVTDYVLFKWMGGDTGGG